MWWPRWLERESSSIRMHRQFLSCSSLRVLLTSHLLREYFHIIPISPHPSLTCLSCMAHRKLGAGWWACPARSVISCWLVAFAPPKGQSSSPFCLGCSISLLSWWIFAIMRFFYRWFFWALACCLLFLPILSNAQPWLLDLLCFPRPGASPLCAGQQRAGTQTGVTTVEDLLKNYNLPSHSFIRERTFCHQKGRKIIITI